MDQEQVRSVLNYDPDAGVFTWRVNRPPRGRAGELAGGHNGGGYIKISLGGVSYYAHRLAFLWVTGDMPAYVDHINRCKQDNRWINLRAVTQKQNVANGPAHRGVRQRDWGRWQARYSGQHLGTFDTEDEAIMAYVAVKNDLLKDVRPTAPKLHPAPRYANPRRYRYKGLSLSEWSRKTGIPQTTLHWRIFSAGMKPDVAMGLRS